MAKQIKDRYDIFNKKVLPGDMVFYLQGKDNISSGRYGILTPYDSLMTYRGYGLSKTNDILNYNTLDFMEYKFPYIPYIYKLEKFDEAELKIYNKLKEACQVRFNGIEVYNKNKRKLKPGSILGNRIDNTYYFYIGKIKDVKCERNGMPYADNSLRQSIGTYSYIVISMSLNLNNINISDIFKFNFGQILQILNKVSFYDYERTQAPKTNLYYVGSLDLSGIYDENKSTVSYIDKYNTKIIWEIE